MIQLNEDRMCFFLKVFFIFSSVKINDIAYSYRTYNYKRNDDKGYNIQLEPIPEIEFEMSFVKGNM